MLLRKFSIILTASALSLFVAAGCSQTAQIPRFSKSKSEDTVTVFVLTRYELTEIEVNYSKYSSWEELLDGEFDGSSKDRSKAVWRGEYILSIGNLQSDTPDDIIVYLNGVYSSRFVKNCEYSAGSALAFVERSAPLP